MLGIINQRKSFRNVKPTENFEKRTDNICLPVLMLYVKEVIRAGLEQRDALTCDCISRQ